MDVQKSTVISLIDDVIDKCIEANELARNTAIQKEISAISDIRQIVQSEWPLKEETKREIVIGPYAAKNLSDWMSNLGDVIMTLDYVLKHDGASIEKLMERCANYERGGA